MPRVTIKRKEYLISDLPVWIEVKRKQCKLKQSYVGKQLGISQQGYSKKVQENSFNYADLIILFQLFNASDEEILKVMKV